MHRIALSPSAVKPKYSNKDQDPRRSQTQKLVGVINKKSMFPGNAINVSSNPQKLMRALGALVKSWET